MKSHLISSHLIRAIRGEIYDQLTGCARACARSVW